jgi:hypothetical protein
MKHMHTIYSDGSGAHAELGHDANAGAGGQVLLVSHRHPGWLYRAGGHWCADLARLGILLPAGGGDDVHARGRPRDRARTLAGPHLGSHCPGDSGAELPPHGALCLGQRSGAEVVLGSWEGEN